MPILFKDLAITGADTKTYGGSSYVDPEEEKRKRQREEAARASAEKLEKQKKDQSFQKQMEMASYAPGTVKPMAPIFKPAPSPVEADEDQAVLEILGGKTLDYTPRAQKLVDLDKRHTEIEKQIKSSAPPAKTGEGTTVIGGAPPDTYFEEQRNRLIAQQYEVQKEGNKVVNEMTADDLDSLTRAEKLQQKIFEINKKAADERRAQQRKLPGGQAISEALTEPVAKGLSVFSFLPGLANRIEAVRKGRASLPEAIINSGREQEIISQARLQANAPETIAGKTSSFLSSFAKFGLEAYATAGVLSEIPVASQVVNAGKAARIAGGTLSVAPTVTQNLARGGLIFGSREAIEQTGAGFGYHPDRILGEAAAGALFEGIVMPGLSRVARRMTTNRVGETTFMYRPGEGGLPSGAPKLPGNAPDGGASWIPKQVKEVWLRTSLDVKGVGRKMTFKMDDGNIYEMVWKPDGAGNVIVQATKDSPNWLTNAAKGFVRKFNGLDDADKPITVKADARIVYSEGSNGTPTVVKGTSTQKNPMARDEYFYHTTWSGNQDSIARNGLVPKNGKVYLDELQDGAKILGMKFGAADHPNDLMLRVSKKGIAEIWGDTKSTMSWYTNKAIRPEHIEALVGDQWMPLSHLNLSVPVSAPPVIVDVPATPMPFSGKDLTTVGMMNLKQFLGGAFYTRKSFLPDPTKFISSKEAIDITRQYFKDTEVPVEIVDRILTPEGDRALGVYREGMISFVQNPHESTPDHEAVHAYLDLFAGKETKDSILQEVIDSGQASNRLDAEEQIADGFVQYVRDGKTRGFSRRVVEFFRDMWNKMRGFFKKPDQVRQLYRDIILRRRGNQMEPGTTVERPVYQYQQSNFQNPEALTLKFLKGITKDEVGQQEIRDLLRRPEVKQPEREIMTQVLDTYFKDQPKISVNDLRSAVQTELLPLKDDLRSSNRSSSSIMEGLRDIHEVDYEGTVIPDDMRGDVAEYQENVWTMPFEHGIRTHFSGLPESQDYFAHTRTEDMARGAYESADTKGGAGKVRRVIEMQSDIYQKQEAMDIIFSQYKSSKAKDELESIQLRVKKHEELAPLYREVLALAKAVKSDTITSDDFTTVADPDMYRWIRANMRDKGGEEVKLERKRNGIDVEYRMKKSDVVSFLEKAVSDSEFSLRNAKSDLEREAPALKAEIAKHEGLMKRLMGEEFYNLRFKLEKAKTDLSYLQRDQSAAVPSAQKEVDSLQKQFDELRAKQKAAMTPLEKGINDYRQRWFERIAKEEIRRAALDGKEVLQFPSGKTAALVEGFLNSGETISADDAYPGTEVEYQGMDMMVVDGGYGADEVKLVPRDKVVWSGSLEDWKTGEYDHYKEMAAEDPENEIGFEALQEFAGESGYRVTLDKTGRKVSVQGNGRTEKYESKEAWSKLSALLESDGVDVQTWLDEKIDEVAQQRSSDADPNDFYPSGQVYMGDGQLVIVEEKTDYEYARVGSAGTSYDNFDPSELGDSEKAIVNFYDRQVIPFLQKYRKGNLELITDDNGVEWWQTKILPEDQAAVEAYQRDVFSHQEQPQMPEEQPKQEPLPADLYQALRKLPEDPEIEPYRKALQEATQGLEGVVSAAEKEIAAATPENPQADALRGLATEIRSVFSRVPRLPDGRTNTQLFSDLAGAGDSVSAINDRLLKIADQVQNPATSQRIRDLVDNRLGGGQYDDITDWTPFQDAITTRKEAQRKPDLIERADRVIEQMGDFEVEPGKKMSDVLDEIDMLEFQLNEKLAERAQAPRQQPKPKAAKQAALPLGKGFAPVQRRASFAGRETTVSGRDLLKALSGLSKAKEKSFKIRLRQAVSEAKKAQKENLSEQYSAKKDEIAGIKGELVNEIRKLVPPERRGKFLATVKNVRTRGQLQKALDRVDQEVAAGERKEAIGRLKDLQKTRTKELRPEFRQPVEELLNSVDTVKRTEKTMSRLHSLADFLRREPDNMVPESALKRLELLSKKSIEELSTEEIGSIADSVAHLIHLNNLKDKLLIRGKLREFGRIQKEAVENVQTNHEQTNGAITGLDSMEIEKEPGTVGKIFTVDSYNAELKAEILDGKDAGVIRQVVYDGIDKGVTEQLRFMQRAEDFFRERTQGIDMSSWSYLFQKKAANVETVSVPLSGGRKLSMTKGERIAFILHNMNPQNRNHLLEGGFAFVNTPSKIVNLTEEDLRAIENSATDEESKVAGAMNEYLNSVQQEAINRVSVDLLGHEIAREKDYFPIRTNYLDRFHDDLIKQGKFTQATLEGMGIFKERQNATNALILEDAFSTVYKSMKQVSAYVGLAQPLRSAKMLLNDNEFQIAARNAGKNHYITSLKDYLQRVEGDSYNLENVDKLTYDLINKLDVAVLGLNPWTMFKQPISFLNAGTEMDWKYLRASARRIPSIQDLAEMRDHSPQLRDRMEGHVTREAGEIAEVGAPMQFFTGRRLMSQKYTEGLERFDRMAITRIWNAAKMEIGENTDVVPNSAEYWQKVADRTELVVRRTQSTSHIKDRSTIGMTRNIFIRMLTRFSSERNKAYMQIRRAAERYNRSGKTLSDKAKFANVLFVVLVATPAIAVGIDKVRNKVYGRTQNTGVLNTALDVVSNALGSVYFLGSAFDSLRSKIQNGTFAGYDIDASGLQFFNQTIDTVAEGAISIGQAITGEKYKSGANKGRAKWEVNAKKFVFDALQTIAQLKGIPTTPIRVVEQFTKEKPEPKTAAPKNSRSSSVDRAGSMTRASQSRKMPSR